MRQKSVLSNFQRLAPRLIQSIMDFVFCLVKSNIRNIFKTTEEISEEACDIIGNQTLEEIKHKIVFEFPDPFFE